VGALSRVRVADLLALHERYPERYPVLLESVSGTAPLGQHDLLLALPGPRLVQEPDGSLGGDVPGRGSTQRFLDALDAWQRAEGVPRVDRDGWAFSGGWFLYLGYELAAEIEPSLRLPRSRLPRAIAWRMRGALVRDHQDGTVRIVTEDALLQAGLERQVGTDLARLSAEPHVTPAGAATAGGRHERVLAHDVEEEEPRVFLQGVAAVLDAIGRGDVYQANLSRAWRARLAPDATAVDLYRALRRKNPAPFAALAQCGEFTVLSSSPERLLQVRAGIASTRPIAGTRPRGGDAAADASLRAELSLNEKERAEHVMLVDLERNDLGRICRAGTVRVDEFMTIESYATVHHIVSNVRGELRDDVTPGRAIAAVFPGGTITGCPKVRCMQILADLEGTPRDAYTGSLGYLGRDGSMDLNILIRTLTLQAGAIGFRTGAGIVADSDPVAELAETRAKARGVLRALGESM
jgi:anthranilate synthase component 1